MLITDGAVDTYDTIFAKYNWPDRKVSTVQTLFDGKPECSLSMINVYLMKSFLNVFVIIYLDGWMFL